MKTHRFLALLLVVLTTVPGGAFAYNPLKGLKKALNLGKNEYEHVTESSGYGEASSSGVSSQLGSSSGRTGANFIPGRAADARYPSYRMDDNRQAYAQIGHQDWSMSDRSSGGRGGDELADQAYRRDPTQQLRPLEGRRLGRDHRDYNSLSEGIYNSMTQIALAVESGKATDKLVGTLIDRLRRRDANFPNPESFPKFRPSDRSKMFRSAEDDVLKFHVNKSEVTQDLQTFLKQMGRLRSRAQEELGIARQKLSAVKQVLEEYEGRAGQEADDRRRLRAWLADVEVDEAATIRKVASLDMPYADLRALATGEPARRPRQGRARP